MTERWILHPATKFREFTESWDQLNQATFKSPVLESRFIQPALEHFGTGAEYIAILEHGEQNLAMAFIHKDKFGCWSTWQPSQAPIGMWLSRADLDIESVLKSLGNTLPGPCGLLSLLQLDSAHIPVPTQSSKLSTLDYIETARISIQSNFQDYWQSRSKNTKKAIRKPRNKLQERGLESRLELITGSEALEEAVSAYGKLESAGWKSESDTAIHIDNLQGKFYLRLLENFAESGDAAIYKFWLNDELAAMDLCISNQRSIIILKTTYDEKYSEFSPALLMHADIFEHIFTEEKFDRIEFYGRTMDWHKRWTNEIRPLYHSNYYHVSLLNSVHKLSAKLLTRSP